MKIKKVNLKNFRQFYGEQQIEFSCDPSKNVTLVHAENTYGKTTLLNSVYWALFEKTTARFQNAKDIVSWPAMERDDSIACVEVEFNDDTNSFLASRAFDQATKKSELDVSQITSGNYTPVPAGVDFINAIIPEEMAKYFFFDGEAAESFSSEKNYKPVGKAIRAILGCSLAEQAINDLKEIDKSLKKEIGTDAADSKIDELREFIDKADEFIEDRLKDIDDLKASIAAKDQLKRNVIAELRDSKESKKFRPSEKGRSKKL